MSEESYFKDVRRRTFIVGWIPFLLMYLLVGFLVYFILDIAFYIFFAKNIFIKEYLLRESFLIDLIWPFLFVFILNLLAMRKTYRLIKEKPFASISHDKLLLNFGKDSFLWDHIQSVNLEEERKLTVIFDDKDTSKKRINDLKWLSKKKDFIHNLKNSCIKRNISYVETEMTLSSRIGLFLRIMKKFLFEPDQSVQKKDK